MESIQSIQAPVESQKKKSARIISVDVLRGMTVCLMVIVNNHGPGAFSQLKHAVWNGFTLADIVFPFFMTIMGISLYFSLSKYEFKPSKATMFKIFKRSVLLIVLGIWMIWTGSIIYAIYRGASGAELMQVVEAVRIPGVLQRLGLCYLLAALSVIFIRNRKVLAAFTIAILIGYSAFLLLAGGYDLSEQNPIARVDIALFGHEHLYSMKLEDGSAISFDPEGLVSSLFATAQVLIGFFIGMLLSDKEKSANRKAVAMLLCGIVMVAIALAASSWLPINKRVWSPTLIVFTSGMLCIVLAILTWIIDCAHLVKWSAFFRVYGYNALLVFLFSEVLVALLWLVGFEDLICNCMTSLFATTQMASLAVGVINCLVIFLVNLVLYVKKISLRL